jgi:hypothetical protein
MFDGAGDSWHGAEMRINQLVGEVYIPLLTTSICAGFTSDSGICLQKEGKFELSIIPPPETAGDIVETLGVAAGTVGWSMCGQIGVLMSIYIFIVYIHK